MNLAQTQSVTLAPKITSAKTLLAQQDDAVAAEAAVETPAEEAAPAEAVEAADVPAEAAEVAAEPVVEEAVPVTEEVIADVVAEAVPAAEIVDPAAVPVVSDASKVIPAGSATGVAVTDAQELERKAWCVDQITPNFFAAPGAGTSGVDQFNTFVNTICPALDLKVPSK